MAGSNNGRGSGNKKKIADQYKDACPPHKLKDLETLVKTHNGDEDKIMKTIQEWWEEPQKVEEEWADVNKKSSKKQRQQREASGGRGRGAGRGRYSRGGGGGRGGGPDGRRGRGRGGRGRGDSRPPKGDRADRTPRNGGHRGSEPPAAAAPAPPPPMDPTPSETVSQPPAQPELQEVVMAVAPAPTPISRPAENIVRSAMPASGNVWATKGSAHLIKAEKSPKPQPAAPVAPPPPKPKTAAPKPVPEPPVQVAAVEEMKESLEPKEIEAAPLAAPPGGLESGLPASVNGANINAAGWKPVPDTPIDTAAALDTTATLDVVKDPTPPAPTKEEPAPPVTKPPPPTNVLSMGRWEANDTDEAQNLVFGSFGTESEAPSVAETTMSSGIEASQASKEAPAPPPAPPAPATAVSPARPPPGLPIAMPPMPTGAVLVSDLEDKLEGTTLAQKEPETPAPVQSDPTPNLPVQPVPTPQESSAPILPQPGGISQAYNTGYGMGMYNYGAAGAAGSGFVSMHAPVLTGGVLPPQQKPQTGLNGQQSTTTSQSSTPQHLPPGGLYGAPTPSIGGNIAGSETSAGEASNSGNTTATSTIPPGMAGGMAYNPALFYSQQPPYQMGQPHGSVGYGYGYGQFGGVQSGFGYQQVMGQGGGYGYDEQAQQQGNANYPKSNSGRYGGRTSGSQYQSQYNPPGYAGQPYSMGYNVDHFGQRTGYAPGSMDPYAMQQQGSGTYGQSSIPGFQNDDDHHKGKKEAGSSNLQQGFQQQHPQQLGGQQPFGLQTVAAESTNTAGAWSNQGGGWGGGPTWQGS